LILYHHDRLKSTIKMKATGIVSAAIASVAFLAGSAAAQSNAASTVDPIVIKGKHMFYKTNGTELYVDSA